MSSKQTSPSEVQLFTIGAYGFTSDSYFESLTATGIDTFCDIRARRGVRGPEYAFVNSTRLQNELNRLGIRYLHFPDLAPSKEIRGMQGEADKVSKIAKRKRTELSDEFVGAY